MTNSAHDSDTQRLLQSRVAELRRLSHAEVARLPESHGDKVVIDGRKCSLTTFVHKLPSGEFLATVQVARPRLFGMLSAHTEHGLVFSADGGVRDAVLEELQNTGG